MSIGGSRSKGKNRASVDLELCEEQDGLPEMDRITQVYEELIAD